MSVHFTIEVNTAVPRPGVEPGSAPSDGAMMSVSPPRYRFLKSALGNKKGQAFLTPGLQKLARNLGVNTTGHNPSPAAYYDDSQHFRITSSLFPQVFRYHVCRGSSSFFTIKDAPGWKLVRDYEHFFLRIFERDILRNIVVAVARAISPCQRLFRTGAVQITTTKLSEGA